MGASTSIVQLSTFRTTFESLSDGDKLIVLKKAERIFQKYEGKVKVYSNSIFIKLIRARNLRSADGIFSELLPFIEVRHGEAEPSSSKTANNELSPVWNETLEVKLDLQDMNQCREPLIIKVIETGGGEKRKEGGDILGQTMVNITSSSSKVPFHASSSRPVTHELIGKGAAKGCSLTFMYWWGPTLNFKGPLKYDGDDGDLSEITDTLDAIELITSRLSGLTPSYSQSAIEELLKSLPKQGESQTPISLSLVADQNDDGTASILRSLSVGDIKQTPSTLATRKELRSMSHKEQERFVAAVETMMKDKTNDGQAEIEQSSEYFQLAECFRNKTSEITNFLQQENFSSWQRAYLVDFEMSLKRSDLANGGDGSIALPYWDWTKHEGCSDEVMPAIIRKRFPTLPTHMLEKFNEQSKENVGESLLVKYMFSKLSEDEELLISLKAAGLQRAVSSCLDENEHYKVASSSTTCKSVRSNFESLHNSVLAACGFPLSSFVYAAFHPCFFLHLCNMDRLYEAYLRYHPNSELEFAATQFRLTQEKQTERSRENLYLIPLKPFKRSRELEMVAGGITRGEVKPTSSPSLAFIEEDISSEENKVKELEAGDKQHVDDEEAKEQEKKNKEEKQKKEAKEDEEEQEDYLSPKDIFDTFDLGYVYDKLPDREPLSKHEACLQPSSAYLVFESSNFDKQGDGLSSLVSMNEKQLFSQTYKTFQIHAFLIKYSCTEAAEQVGESFAPPSSGGNIVQDGANQKKRSIMDIANSGGSRGQVLAEWFGMDEYAGSCSVCVSVKERQPIPEVKNKIAHDDTSASILCGPILAQLDVSEALQRLNLSRQQVEPFCMCIDELGNVIGLDQTPIPEPSIEGAFFADLDSSLIGQDASSSSIGSSIQPSEHEIRSLQRFLYKFGYLHNEQIESTVCDGLFGKQTLEAVEKFQVFVGATPDGVVGPVTKSLILSSRFDALPDIDVKNNNNFTCGICSEPFGTSDVLTAANNATITSASPCVCSCCEVLLCDRCSTVDGSSSSSSSSSSPSDKVDTNSFTCKQCHLKEEGRGGGGGGRRGGRSEFAFSSDRRNITFSTSNDNSVKFHVGVVPGYLSQSEVEAEIFAVLVQWGYAAGLDVMPTKEKEEALVRVVFEELSGTKNENLFRFDMIAGCLAHADLENKVIILNSSERWFVNDHGSIAASGSRLLPPDCHFNIGAVVSHEFGHILGLAAHSPHAEDIMSPFYAFSNHHRLLVNSRDTIAAVKRNSVMSQSEDGGSTQRGSFRISLGSSDLQRIKKLYKAVTLEVGLSLPPNKK